MVTVNGPISWSRRRWAGGPAGSSHPVDRLLDETEAAVSVGVRQLCCREGGNARSFARGCENLAHLAQIKIGKDWFRLLVESDGKAMLKASAHEQLELDWSASSCLTKTPAGQETTRIYVSADGVMVPTTTQAEKDQHRATMVAKRAKMSRKQRKRLKKLGAVKKGSDDRYKQVYITAFYDQEQDHRLVGLTRQGVKGLRRLLGREAARVRILGAAERRGAVDGAVCLRSNLEDLPLQKILLDFYHLGEHVGEAGSKTLGAESQAAKQWIEEALHAVRHVGYPPFFDKLLDWRSRLRGAKRHEADRLIHYVAARQDMIGYEDCDAHGWHVGSGPIESMCGVTTDRIKGRGRRWDLDNAEALMAIEALYQSTGLWDKYWTGVLCHRN